MSSWTFETFKTPHKIYPDWTIFAEYRWDKYNGWEMGVYCDYGTKVYGALYHNTYATKEGAKRAFNRQVAKLKRGEY